ncbi:glutamate ABC transporter substrate-binding protein [Kitasatospora sp. SC0581]|uniref:glutamate ABC transporter substrate-binding protein n=1 Tax=Kitasatospora sp. SC0581 TaxID=3394360 RepID=UPI003A85EA65
MRTRGFRSFSGSSGSGGSGGSGRRTRPAVAVALLAAGAAVLAGGGPVGAAPAAVHRTKQDQQEQADGCDVTKSVPPSTDDGPAVKAIKARRSLVIGVDQNSYRWGARNPNTGQIEGFDIDLARAIGAAVMGDPEKVVLKPVATADRIDAIKKGRVDLIVRTMTINCKRMEDVAFSKPYFNITQRVLVPTASPAKNIDDAVKDQRVCAAAGSTALTVVTEKKTARQVVTVENQLDCLVLMQLGKVDATMTDNGLAAGQAAQDQTVRIVDGEAQPEVVGVAMLKDSTDLTARVNQVLADYYARGDWARSYEHWLKPYMLNEADRYWPGTR